MPDVFISYARASAAQAQRVAKLLAAAGHDVWFDAELPPNRAYSDVIQEQLEAARAVVVLWSPEAAKSEWVRAEADYARGRHKLVQAALDDIEPPMPFNQIQCAQLKRWRGDPTNHEWKKLAAAVAQLAAAPGGGDVAGVGPGRGAARPDGRSRAREILIAVGAVVLAALVGLVGWRVWSRLVPAPAVAEAKVALLPFATLSPGPDAQFFAAGLTDKILTTLSASHIQVVSQQDAAALRGTDRRRKVVELGVALLLDGAVQADGKTLDVRVHLDDPAHQVTLWSTEVEGPASDSHRLQGRIAATVVGVVACSRRAIQPKHGLSDPALLARYLRACDLFVNKDDATSPQDTFEMLAALREVAAKAPGFAAAHADLAKFDAYLAPLMPPEQAKAFREESAREATRALALEPRSPDAFLARAMLLPANHWAEREALLRQGVAADPAWPHTNGFLAKMLAESGRLKEAKLYGDKAAAADLQIDWSEESSWIGAATGQAEPALSVLKADHAAFPNSVYVWSRLLAAEEFTGKWEDAGQAMTAPAAAAINAPRRAMITTFIQAARSQAPGDLARARTAALAAGNGVRTSEAIEVLSYLGYVDDAFALADRYAASQGAVGDASFLFFPLTAKLRRDPRFLGLAARIGLVEFWRTSGKWPDFCADPTLPYSCRAGR